jgi:cytochrome P450
MPTHAPTSLHTLASTCQFVTPTFDDSSCAEMLCGRSWALRLLPPRDNGGLRGHWALSLLSRTSTVITQDYWEGKAATRRFHKLVAGLLAELHAKRRDEACFGAHLLDVRDPSTGQPLDDERLAPEIALLFLAGFESARSPVFLLAHCLVGFSGVPTAMR